LDAIPPVGAGLLANTSFDSASTSLTHRVRQQAGSYRFRAESGVCASLRIWPMQANATTAAMRAARHCGSQEHHRHSNETPSVGAGLLANTSFDPASTSLTHRVRQQAGSYRFRAASGVCASLRIWPMQANATTAAMQTDRQPGIAVAWRTTVIRVQPPPVGAGLLAKASFDPASTSQGHRIRGQARSYRFCAALGVLRWPLIQHIERDLGLP
jgi:aromatic ring-cleaving dioxygenase